MLSQIMVSHTENLIWNNYVNPFEGETDILKTNGKLKHGAVECLYDGYRVSISLTYITNWFRAGQFVCVICTKLFIQIN